MLKTFSGKRYSIKDSNNDSINLPDSYDVVRIASDYGLGLGKGVLHYGHAGGGNSGFQAVNLAYLFGADLVILLGFDMGGPHFFGEHPPPLRTTSPYSEFKKTFESIDQQELCVINCTRKTGLACFPQMSLESVLSLVQAPV